MEQKMLVVPRFYPPHPDIDVDTSVEACEHCGLKYKDLRTGYTYKEVRDFYWVNSPDSEKWKYKRRNTVLGKWRELKLLMWEEHLEMCAELALYAETGNEGD